MEQSQPQPCNQKQREIFARLLAEAKNREELGLESTDDLDKRIEEEFLPKLAQEKGASPLIARDGSPLFIPAGGLPVGSLES